MLGHRDRIRHDEIFTTLRSDERHRFTPIRR
jgi:hypothetical protein